MISFNRICVYILKKIIILIKMEDIIINKILNKKLKRSQSNLNNNSINIKPKKPKLIQKKFLRKKRYSSNYCLTKKNMNNREAKSNLRQESKIRENAIINIIKILNQNEDLKAKGNNYIKNLANKLENELIKLNPAINFYYQKSLSNMYKSLKEIIKQKSLIQLIIYKNINLSKIAMIPYGEELNQEIKKILSQHKIKNKENIVNKNKLNIDKENMFHPHLYEPLSQEKINLKILNPISYDFIQNLNHSLKLNESETEIDTNKSNISSTKIEEKVKNEEINIVLKNKDENFLLRIYHGQIKLNHKFINNISLFSKYDAELFKKFHSFGDILNLKSKVETSKIIPYCLRHLNDNSKILLFGWLEPDLDKMNIEEKNIEIDKFISLINEFDKEDKCSNLKDKKIKLYIFVLKKTDELFTKIFINEINFNNELIKERLEKEKKFLVFALIANTDYLDKKNFKEKKGLTPEIIHQIPKEEKDEKDKLYEKENEKLKKLLEKKDFDFNSWIKKNFGNLNEEQLHNKFIKYNEENRYKLLELVHKSNQKINKMENYKVINNNINYSSLFRPLNNNNIVNDYSKNNLLTNVFKPMNINYNYQFDKNLNEMMNIQDRGLPIYNSNISCFYPQINCSK